MLKNLTREQKTILWVLSLINFINYLDRQVVFPLFHSIKLEFHISDFQLGLLGSAFMLVHSLASLPLGVLADRVRRRLVVAGGVAFWSVMSFASGLAASFHQLLGLRAAVGIGEAAYAPAATAMISDNLPQSFWSRAQGIFNAAMMVGGTLGAIVGGLIAFYFNHNWRLAFFLVSPLGLILAVAALKLKESGRLHFHHSQIKLSGLSNNWAYWWIIISGVFATFASGAFITWGVEFVSRYKGYNLRDAGLILGSTLMAAGVLGVILGSMVADALQKKIAYGRSLAVAVALILAAPFMYIGLASSSRLIFFPAFFIGTLLFSVYHGPVTAVMHDVVPQSIRASAFALYVLLIHLIGDTLAPALVGKLSDSIGLLSAMEWSAVCVGLSGLTFIAVVELIRRGKVTVYKDTPGELVV